MRRHGGYGVCMRTLLLPLLGILGGTFLSIQAPINANLGGRLGHPILAAAISFTAGVLVLYAAILAFGLRPTPGTDLRTIPVHLWFMGGLMGISYMVVSIFLVPRIGSAAVIGTAVTGQLLAALVIDKYGLLALPVRELTLTRIAGAVLLLAGVVLIVRR